MRRVALLAVVLGASAAYGRDLRRPTAIALGWYDRKGVHLPVVTTRPAWFGEQLTKNFLALSRPVSCRVDLLAPQAIDVTCAHRDRTTREFYWLERDSPPVTLAEFGIENIDVVDSGCPDTCRFDDKDFAIDTKGITFLPVNTCVCADLPGADLDSLAAQDARARALIAWLTARADAGEDAVSWTLDAR